MQRSKQAENKAAKLKEKKQNNVKSAQNQGSMPPPETRDKKAASQNANSNQHQVAINQTSIQLQQYHQHGHNLKVRRILQYPSPDNIICRIHSCQFSFLFLAPQVRRSQARYFNESTDQSPPANLFGSWSWTPKQLSCCQQR